MTMAFEIADYNDLVLLLHQRPERRAELRELILSIQVRVMSRQGEQVASRGLVRLPEK